MQEELLYILVGICAFYVLVTPWACAKLTSPVPFSWFRNRIVCLAILLPRHAGLSPWGQKLVFCPTSRRAAGMATNGGGGISGREYFVVGNFVL